MTLIESTPTLYPMRLLLLFATSVTLTGCSKNLEQEIRRQKEEVASLKNEIALLAAQQKDLTEREVRFSENVRTGMIRLEADIQSSRRYMELLTDINKWEKSAQLSSSSKEFSSARNEFGTFPILVDSAEPYLDGHKVVFRVGNMNAAAVNGASVVVSYAPREPALPLRKEFDSDEAWNKAYSEYQATWNTWMAKKKKTSSIGIGDLAGGSWNEVEVIISPSKPDELGFLDVSLSATGVGMRPAVAKVKK